MVQHWLISIGGVSVGLALAVIICAKVALVLKVWPEYWTSNIVHLIAVAMGGITASLLVGYFFI